MDYSTNSTLSVNVHRHNYKSIRIQTSTHELTHPIKYMRTFNASTFTIAAFPSVYVCGVSFTALDYIVWYRCMEVSAKSNIFKLLLRLYLMLLYVFVGNAVVISFGLLSAGRFTLHIHHCYSFAFSHPPFHPRALVIFDIQSNTVHSVDNTRFIFTWEYYTVFFGLTTRCCRTNCLRASI